MSTRDDRLPLSVLADLKLVHGFRRPQELSRALVQEAALHNSWPLGTGYLPGVEKENACPARLLKRILLFLPGRVGTPGAPTAERPAQPLLTPLAPHRPYKALALVDRNRDRGRANHIRPLWPIGTGLVIPNCGAEIGTKESRSPPENCKRRSGQLTF